MSLPGKPSARTSSTMRIAWGSDFAIQTTELSAMNILLEPLRLRNVELVVDAADAGDLRCCGADVRLLHLADHGSTQCDHAIDRDDLDVVRTRGERLVLHDRLPHRSRDLQVLLVIRLLIGGLGV